MAVNLCCLAHPAVNPASLDHYCRALEGQHNMQKAMSGVRDALKACPQRLAASRCARRQPALCGGIYTQTGPPLQRGTSHPCCILPGPQNGLPIAHWAHLTPWRRHPPRRSVSVQASAGAEWLKEDRRRMLHVVYRVGDMQKHIDYYKNMFGMQLLRYRCGAPRNPPGWAPGTAAAGPARLLGCLRQGRAAALHDPVLPPPRPPRPQGHPRGQVLQRFLGGGPRADQLRGWVGSPWAGAAPAALPGLRALPRPWPRGPRVASRGEGAREASALQRRAPASCRRPKHALPAAPGSCSPAAPAASSAPRLPRPDPQWS
jgi:catechol 2,3-dioxygenase-like lactoylglutathione lyase family enzyme